MLKTAIRLRATQNLVGSPHPISNIRPVQYTQRTPFTEQQKEADQFNHAFWHENNRALNAAKVAFEDEWKAKHPNGTETAFEDALGEFHKRFLDQAEEKYLEYNREWWRRNVAITLAGFRQFFNRKQSGSN